MAYYVGKDVDTVVLSHFGVKGMKWGVRRYQNEDGSLTEAGKERYYDYGDKKQAKSYQKRLNELDRVYSDSSKRIASLARKQAKTKPTRRKASRLANKMLQEEKIASTAKAFMDNILSEASSKGYTISSKNVTRMSEDARAAVTGLLGGIGSLAVSNIWAALL